MPRAFHVFANPGPAIILILADVLGHGDVGIQGGTQILALYLDRFTAARAASGFPLK